MNYQPFESIQFTDSQRQLFEDLRRLVGNGPALMYRDASRVLNSNPPFDAATHIVMHLFREIENSFRGLLVPQTGESISDDDKSRHVNQINAILSFLQIPDDDEVAAFWKNFRGDFHKWAHRESLAPPRSINEPEFRDIVYKTETLFNYLLRKCEENYIIFYTVLDKLLQIPTPSKNDVKTLLNDVPNNIHSLNYFFSQANANWLIPLKNKHFFQRPLEPIDGVIFPWPQSKYLVRVVDDKPDEVWAIVLEIPSTRNLYIHNDICQISLKMPAQKVVDIIPQILQWLDDTTRFSDLPLNIAQVSRHLAHGGETKGALNILQNLLEIRHSSNDTNPHSSTLLTRFDEAIYENIVEEIIPDLVLLIGVPLIELLCELMADSLKSTSLHQNVTNYDPSIRISLNPQSFHRGIQFTLLRAIQQGLHQLTHSDVSNTPILVNRLLSFQFSIFHRLAFDLISKDHIAVPQILAEVLTNKEYLKAYSIEYRLLLSRKFSQLDPSQQEAILEWAANNIPDYERLRSSIDNPNLVDFDAVKLTTWAGPTSPITYEELQVMSIEDIVDFLHDWQPPKEFMSPSFEGLGRSLSKAISASPQRFAENALLFRKLEPTYIRNILIGFQQAIRDITPFPWDKILELCQWVIDQPWDTAPIYVDNDRDPDWRWTRGEIADLLHLGFNAELISENFRSVVWDILKPITMDSDPTPEYENQYINVQYPPSYASMNTTRGKAIHSVIAYALWVARGSRNQLNTTEAKLGYFDDMPEVRDTLNKHLDIDRSLTIRSIYGQYLHHLMFLDKEWLTNVKHKIFSEKQEDVDLYNSAWETYLIHSQANNNIFELLESNYRRAINSLSASAEIPLPAYDPTIQLVHHLMTFYWLGVTRLDVPNSLIHLFYIKASPKLREEALRFLGLSLKQATSPIDPKIQDRLMHLWSYRLVQIKLNPNDHREELNAFKWWFESGKLEPVWSLTHLNEILVLLKSGDVILDRSVLERLALIEPEAPKLVVQALDLLITKNQDTWFMRLGEGAIKEILTNILDSPDMDAQIMARKLINQLVSRGLVNFRTLLN